ncbi:MAG: MFS transporter, partial [Nitrososphaeria archaeon]
DLFSITIVLYILSVYAEPSFPLNLKVLSLPLSAYLATSAILFAIVGQLLFGIISDKLGRKKVYGLEATLLALGAILSAFSPNIYWLIASRALLGVGIGGDYPVSSVITSEYGNAKDRGKMVALVFSNQGLGIIAAALVGIASALFIPPSIAWRTVMGAAAIPALAVIYFRRKMPETPRYSYHVKKISTNLKKPLSISEYTQTMTCLRKALIELRKKWPVFSRFIKKLLETPFDNDNDLVHLGHSSLWNRCLFFIYNQHYSA